MNCIVRSCFHKVNRRKAREGPLGDKVNRRKAREGPLGDKVNRRKAKEGPLGDIDMQTESYAAVRYYSKQ